jgi:ferritin
MAIKKALLTTLNKQINEELHSAYIYLGMAAYFEAENLSGFANWMKKQSQEEIHHAMKLYEYINDRGEKVVLDALAAPPKTWKSPLDAFETAFKHEQHISNCIHKLVDQAKKEGDHPTFQMLQWFVEEQVEEEASAEEIVQKLTLAKGNPSALLFLDGQLGKRTGE